MREFPIKRVLYSPHIVETYSSHHIIKGSSHHYRWSGTVKWSPAPPSPPAIRLSVLHVVHNIIEVTPDYVMLVGQPSQPSQ